jgi:AcrR family transcriptional regulator
VTAAAAGDLAPDARESLLRAAEKLFAEVGIGAASLRRISVAAGQRNNSAAQYHFGSKAGLVSAIVQARLGPINARRADLLAAADADGRGDDVAALVEALVVPLVEFTIDRPDGSSYARFLAASYGDPQWSEVALESEHGAVFREWRRRLEGALAHLPQPLRRLRVDRAVIGVITDVARWEGGRRRRGVGRSEMIADLVAWTSAGLLAAAPGRGPATTGAPA